MRSAATNQIFLPVYYYISSSVRQAFFRAAGEFSTVVLPLVCLLPFIFGIVAKLVRHIHEFIDTEAIVCAGQNVLVHVSPYAPAVHCGRMEPARFVYPPITAWVEAAIQPHISPTGVVMIYGFIYFAVFFAIVRAALRKDALLYLRGPFLLSFSASGLLAGNVSVIFHGLLFFIAVSTVACPLFLWPAIVLAGILKPTFAVYTGVFLFQRNLDIWRRLALASSAVMAIGLTMVWTFHVDPTEFLQWLARLHAVNTYSDFVQGHSFLVSLEMIGIHGPKAQMLLYVPFASTLLLLGLAIVHYADLSARDSVILGISICLLLYPRLLDYDEYTLPFGLAVLAASFDRVRWLSPSWFRGIVLVGCLTFALVGGFRGGVVLYWFSVALLLTLALQLVIQNKRTSYASAPS